MAKSNITVTFKPNLYFRYFYSPLWLFVAKVYVCFGCKVDYSVYVDSFVKNSKMVLK